MIPAHRYAVLRGPARPDLAVRSSVAPGADAIVDAIVETARRAPAIECGGWTYLLALLDDGHGDRQGVSLHLPGGQSRDAS